MSHTHTTHAAESHEDHGAHPHINYKKIYIWLIILFLMSVAGPELTDHKMWVLFFAFGIAIIKAIMVVGYFMHFAYEKKYIWYAFMTVLGFLFLFFMAVAPDIMQKEGQNWKSNIVVEAKGGHGEHGSDSAHEEAAAHGESATEVSHETPKVESGQPAH